MKNIHYIAILLLIFFTSCQSRQSGLLIHGEFEGIQDGTTIELIPGATMNDEKPVATAVVTDGKFTFTDTLPEPRFFYLKIEGINGVFPFMAENAEINITGKLELKTTGDYEQYDFSDIKISGSAVHEEYKQKSEVREKLDSLYKANQLLGKDILYKINTARQAKDTTLLKSLEQTPEYKAMIDRDKVFFATVEQEYKKVIFDNKDSWWGPFLMLNLMNYFSEDQREWYNAFPENVKTSYYGKLVLDNLPRGSWVGRTATDFTGDDIVDGASLNLKEVAGANKYVLIDFWASWCAPCKREIPNIKDLYAELHSKGFDVISVSIDKDPEAWKNAVKQFDLQWHNLRDVDGTISDSYKVKAVPEMFVIDNTGKIVLDQISGEELAKALRNLLK